MVALGSFDLDGRVVIVTGAGQGIGAGIARVLGRLGAHVVVAERRADRAERTVAEIAALGGAPEALALACDITDAADVDRTVAGVLDRFGRIDALVNNAHAFTPRVGLADAQAMTDLDANHATTRGVLAAMQAVRPAMAAAAWGRIVNVASAAGRVGLPGYGPYSAAKEAIRALTRTAAREWGRDGIVVNAVCPGAASKRGTEALARDDAASRAFLRDHPIGRQGDPDDDIAPVVAFLCSDGCRYLTGQTLMVDGGAFLWS